MLGKGTNLAVERGNLSGEREPSRFAALRAMITSPELTFLMEAHNVL